MLKQECVEAVNNAHGLMGPPAEPLHCEAFPLERPPHMYRSGSLPMPKERMAAGGRACSAAVTCDTASCGSRTCTGEGAAVSSVFMS